jgi:histidinol phosphatase-like enzyme
LLERAARDHGIDLAGSWMIGDILDDVEAGRRAGCRTVLLDVGNETEWRVSDERSPHFIAASLGDAVRIVTAKP